MSADEFLCWAAGADVPMPTGSALDESALRDAVFHHRIAGRFIQRLAGAPPAWASAQLVEFLQAQHDRALDTLRRQLVAVREACAAIDSPAGPPVLLKGVTTYALTGDPFHVRHSEDADVIVPALEPAKGRLEELGYKYWPPAAAQEYGYFRRPGMQIDLHRHFPVWSYSPDIVRADLSAASNPGVWVQRGNAERTPIEYPDVLAAARSGLTPNTADLRIVEPTLAVLLLCSHAFRDYARLIVSPHGPCVHLYELADARDLARHPRFDGHRFRSLTRSLGAECSVRFMNALLVPLLRCEPLPLDAGSGDGQPQSEQPRFPRRIWNGYGFWIDLGWSPRELLRPPPSLRDLLDHLGANDVTVRGERYSVLAPAMPESAALRRVLVHADGDERLPLALSASLDDSGLTLELTTLVAPRHDTRRVRVEVPSHTWELWMTGGAGGVVRTAGAPCEWTMRESPPGYLLRIHFGKTLLDTRDRNEALPVLIGIADQASASGASVATLVPVMVGRGRC